MAITHDIEIRNADDFKRETARMVRTFAAHMFETYETDPRFKEVSPAMAGKISFAMQTLEELAKMFENAKFISNIEKH